MRVIDIEKLNQDAEEAIYFLLGKIIVRKVGDSLIKRRITEAEIYKQIDSACHAYKGKTKRNSPLYEQGGTMYVYLCYGLHYLINIVTGEKGNPQGIMIRGLDSVFGSGRVGKILQVDNNLNFENVLTSEEIWLEDDGYIVETEDVLKLKRVGIGYALEEDQNRLWRFRLKGF